jgi:hypothetical protein
MISEQMKRVARFFAPVTERGAKPCLDLAMIRHILETLPINRWVQLETNAHLRNA